ncbi:SPFH domain-containing protein [Streptomyces sp. NPDC002044]|uniref:SPFH domain-containing protein n=1 Tax=Streptomyces sp. NPDC002044 TaxID=3154662 RepID=UPI00331A7A5A
MYPTRTTSTTGTFRIPPAAAQPVRPALTAEAPAASAASPTAPTAPTAWTEASPAAPYVGPAPSAAPAPAPIQVPEAFQVPGPGPVPVPLPVEAVPPARGDGPAPEPRVPLAPYGRPEPSPAPLPVPIPVEAVPAARADAVLVAAPSAGEQAPAAAPYARTVEPWPWSPVPDAGEVSHSRPAEAVAVRASGPVPTFGPAEAAPDAGPAREEAPARRAEAVSALPHTRPTPAAEEPEPAYAPPYDHPVALVTGPREGAEEPEARPAEAPVPAARARAGSEQETLPQPGPHPNQDLHQDFAQHQGQDEDQDRSEDQGQDQDPHPEPEPQHSGVPGPGVAEIVAQAVARGLEREDDDTQDLPLVPPAAPLRGAAATEVPLHLPFRADPQPPAATPETASTLAGPDRPARPRPVPGAAPARPAPGRRVPRGDDRLREHRGPVLPGWIGVAVGGLALAGCVAVLWRAGVVPASLVAAFGAPPRAYEGLRATHWPPLAFLGVVALLALGGLGRARTGHAWVLTLFGRYRGTVRRTGLTWVSPLLLRRRVDVRLRHWRSDPMPAVDSGGLALQVVVQVVWQVKDTARATLAVADHTEYLAEQVESAMARVLSQLPADAFHEAAPTLRDAEAVGDALTRMLAAETEAVGVEVFSAQPTRIEYAPEVAEAMRRRRVAAIDAKHRDTVLTSVVDAVDDTVHRLTSRGIVELDDYERKALVKDLTVAFYTGRSE